MRKIHLLLCAVCLSLNAAPAFSEMYTWVDDKGVIHVNNTIPPRAVKNVNTSEEIVEAPEARSERIEEKIALQEEERKRKRFEEERRKSEAKKRLAEERKIKKELRDQKKLRQLEARARRIESKFALQKEELIELRLEEDRRWTSEANKRLRDEGKIKKELRDQKKRLRKLEASKKNRSSKARSSRGAKRATGATGAAERTQRIHDEFVRKTFKTQKNSTKKRRYRPKKYRSSW